MIYHQAAGFIVVGVFLAGIELISFRFLSQKVNWNRYAANICSTSAALTVSLLANRGLVFRPEDFEFEQGIARFLSVTLISAWGVQNLMLWILSKWRTGDAILLRLVACAPEFGGKTSLLFNGLGHHKLAAIAAGLIWNFCWYRWWVFV